jgi:hypothetical protein
MRENYNLQIKVDPQRQKMNENSEMEGGMIVYTHLETGFTIDNYAKGPG